jgi:hypothetical protein
VKAYTKQHQVASNSEDKSEMETLNRKHDKLYKVTDGIDDRETREHLFDHITGKHEGALPTKQQARDSHEATRRGMASARVDRAASAELAEKKRSGTALDQQYAKELAVGRINKAMTPNVRLLKSTGEGSHGGRVIGHTKSGKPIYTPSKPLTQKNHKTASASHVAEAHADFSAQDHKDAVQLHRNMWGNQGGGEHAWSHTGLADAHADAYRAKSK